MYDITIVTNFVVILAFKKNCMNWLWEKKNKKNKEEGCFKLEWKDSIIFKKLGKYEIKLYYNNFESVFF